MAFSAILDPADPRHRAKLRTVLKTAYRTIVFVPLIVLYPAHWLTWVAIILVLTVISVGHDYFSSYPGRLWLPWCLGVGGLALAALFADATVQAAQHGGLTALGIALCAIGALFSGFCFGSLVTRWRA